MNIQRTCKHKRSRFWSLEIKKLKRLPNNNGKSDGRDYDIELSCLDCGAKLIGSVSNLTINLQD